MDITFASKVAITAGVSATFVLMLRRFIFGATAWCKNKVLISGKTVLITGANTGIGKATAIELAKRKARVILACRDVEKAKKAASEIQDITGGKSDVEVKHLDLASFSSIRTFANDILDKEPKIDILINNAGVFRCPYQKTQDGFEMQFGVNHLGPFLLTNLLLPKLVASQPSRIIMVSSSLYKKAEINFENLNGEKSYNRALAYGHSKLAGLLCAHELSKRLPDGVTVNSVHPGVVWTELGRHVISGFWMKVLYPIVAFLLLKSPLEGAQTIIHVATDPDIDKVSGKYFGNCKMDELLPKAKDDEVALKLWQVCQEMTMMK